MLGVSWTRHRGWRRIVSGLKGSDGGGHPCPEVRDIEITKSVGPEAVIEAE